MRAKRIAFPVNEALSPHDLLKIAEMPVPGRIRFIRNTPCIELQIQPGIFVPAQSLINHINLREFSATPEENARYLKLIRFQEILGNDHYRIFDNRGIPSRDPQLQRLDVKDCPGLATIRAFSNKLDMMANMIFTDSQYADLIPAHQNNAAVSRYIRSAIWHMVMVNDGINTLKALAVLNQLAPSNTPSVLTPKILFSSQRTPRLKDHQFELRQVLSTTPIQDIALQFYDVGKTLLCFKDAGTHPTTASLSFFPQEHEIPLQPGERFRTVAANTSWLKAVTARIPPGHRCIGFEPENPSDWITNTHLKVHFQHRPWLIHKMFRLAHLLNKPDLVTTITTAVPEVNGLATALATGINPVLRRHQLRLRITAAENDTLELQHLSKKAILSGNMDLAQQAALKLSRICAPNPLSQSARNVPGQPARTPLYQLIHSLSDQEKMDYIPAVISAVPETAWTSQQFAEIQDLILSLMEPKQQLPCFLHLYMAARDNQMLEPERCLINAWNNLSHISEPSDLQTYTPQLLTLSQHEHVIRHAFHTLAYMGWKFPDFDERFQIWLKMAGNASRADCRDIAENAAICAIKMLKNTTLPNHRHHYQLLVSALNQTEIRTPDIVNELKAMALHNRTALLESA